MQTILKVCGLTDHTQNHHVVHLQGVTHAGFIFADSSPRFVDHTFPTPGVKRTGVFVNADSAFIKESIWKHQLDCVQLHGNETPEQCNELRQFCEVIKSFGILDSFDLNQTEAYHGSCDFFLFDTKTSDYGGSGVSFDWKVLSHYTGYTPFLLSGGIGLSSLQDLRSFSHPMCIGLDLNSRFELQPGIKNHQLIETFIHELNNTHFSRS